MGGGRTGEGWRGQNPPTTQATRRQGPDGGDGMARCKRTAAPSATIETAAGDGGEGPRPEHFDGADGARTKNGMHPRREYDNVVSEATERGQARARVAAGEDGHGATGNRAAPRRAEEGDETPQSVIPTHKLDRDETEARAPTE